MHSATITMQQAADLRDEMVDVTSPAPGYVSGTHLTHGAVHLLQVEVSERVILVSDASPAVGASCRRGTGFPTRT
jgi:hypothetical protein